jgi:Domain of unknown function (DUF6431)
MTKILHFGRSCKAYLRLYESSTPNISICCEDCGHHLHKHGRYYRVVATKRELFRIPIYRQYCPDCGKTISLLPDFLVPWARCATWVREAAMIRRWKGFTHRRNIESTSVATLRYSRRTLKRWWKAYILKVDAVALWIAKQLTSQMNAEDLLHLYPAKIAPTSEDTMDWLEELLLRYSPAKPWRRGYWSPLNRHLPVGMWL